MPRDERTFITVHDGIDEHPKIEALSDAAFRLLISTWAWCSRNRTDGRVRAASWTKRGAARARKELITAGLAVVRDDGDIDMHDYLRHQRSAAEIDELSAKRRAAGSKGGKAKASATDVAKQTASKDVAETETDRARDTSSSSARDTRRRTRLPPDWRPTDADVTWQRDAGIADTVARRQLDLFRDHWKGNGETKADWSATWRNWLRRAPQFDRDTPPARPPAERTPGDFSHIRATRDF